jgi:rRNA maturation protein Nop10
MSKAIQYCLNCDGYTLLDEDDYDFCKKCQIATLQERLEQEKKLGLYLFKKFVPESDREQVAKAAYSSLK